jgi:hypothetical protein
MKNTLFVFLLFITTISFGQKSGLVSSAKKKSAHVLRVRVVNGLSDPKTAGPVVVEVVEVYKSKTFSAGETFAIKMQPFSITDDSAKVSHLENGNELIVFISKEDPKSFSLNGKSYSYYSLYDDWLGWMFYNEQIGELMKKK